MAFQIPDHNRDDGQWCHLSKCDSSTGSCPLGCTDGQQQAIAIRVIRDQANEVTYEPWTDGHAIGFKVTQQGVVRYVYLNPSVDGESPDVFLYHGLGKPDADGAICFIDPFGDPEAGGNDPADFPVRSVRNGTGMLPEGTLADCSECGTKLIKGSDGKWRPTGGNTIPCPSGAGHLAVITEPATSTVNLDNALYS